MAPHRSSSSIRLDIIQGLTVRGEQIENNSLKLLFDYLEPLCQHKRVRTGKRDLTPNKSV